MQAKDKLIVALDVDNFPQAEELIDILSPEVEIFKIGVAPFTDFGDKILRKLQKAEKKIFLDLKVHDIPNTVANAVRAAAGKNVFMMNFHCLGGLKMLKAAADEADKLDAKSRPILLGVTILTSMGQQEMEAIGLTGSVEEKVIEFSRLAAKAGLDGVVASAREVQAIKREMGKEFIAVTPGVRPDWAERGDQKRVLTPKQAVSAGADYIVVGRPVIQAGDPLLAAKKIIREITN